MSENAPDAVVFSDSTARQHPFTGLLAGDYFIHRFNFDGHVTHAYGYLRAIDGAGRYHADYMAQTSPARPETVEKEDHQVVGRITRRGYLLAEMRNWPNDENEVANIVSFSAGRPVEISWGERIRLFFS